MEPASTVESSTEQDVLGLAILDALNTGKNTPVDLSLNGVQDDPMDAATFLRTYAHWPEMEKQAVALAAGRVADLGAGGGCHSLYLQDTLDVTAVEKSPLCCKVMQQQGIQKVVEADVWEWQPERPFDTLLLLMNGIGMCGGGLKCTDFLKHLTTFLAPGGSIIGESTSVAYMYDDWKDRPRDYPGDAQFEVGRNGAVQTFDWVYLEPLYLAWCAHEAGLDMEMLSKTESGAYLVRLTRIEDKAAE